MTSEATSNPIRCPDCGHTNPAGRTSCERCNFPFEAISAPAPATTEAAAASEDSPTPYLPPRRPRRPPRGMPPEATSLWLLFGGLAAIAVVWVAIQANVERARQPVEGARVDQQKAVDELRDVLARDSTNADAHQALADVLYDTGNWPDAIVHYRAALRRDTSRTTAIVDLGVCYYNLGQTLEAEKLFRRALAQQPNQPVALFNLGILHERREEYEAASQFYHRALSSNPPEDMKPVVLGAMQRIQETTGAQAPPLPGVK